jgi:hypothetical protein
MQIGERLLGGLCLFAVRVELEIGLVFGDSFVLLLQLQSDFGEGEVSSGILGLDADGVFGAEVGSLIVFVTEIKLCDVEILVDTLIVGLNSFDLGELAMDRGSFWGIAVFGRRVGVGRSGGIVTAAGTGAAATGVVTGEFGWRLRGKGVLRCGV